MPGINTGLLTNAYPLTTEQILELERRVLENQEAFVFLDNNSKLCFAIPHGVDGIKDLAWDNVYELATQDATLIKKEYKKVSLKFYHLKDTFTKKHSLDAWQPKGIRCLTYDNLTILDSNGLILTIKETE